MTRLKRLFLDPVNTPKSPLPTSCSPRLAVWGVALASSLFFLILYLVTVAPSLGAGHDTGELTTSCVIQGVPHSPGYPLFVALGWLATQFPFQGDPAYKINLLCAVEVALAMGFLGASLALATRPVPALIATGLAGSCTAVWRQAVAAEVFALHLLLLSILIWLAILWEHSEDARRREILLATSFIVGCSLAHQHIMALAAPIFVVFGIYARGRGRTWGFSWLNLPIFLASMLLPYYLQWYIACQSPAINWNDVTTLDRLLDHFLRKTYGTGLLNAAALQFDARTGDAQVSAFFISLVRNYFVFPSFLFILAAFDRLLMKPRPEPKVLLFLGIAIVYGPFFGKLGNQPSAEFFFDMMERFYASSMLGLAGLIALGIDWAAFSLWPASQRYLALGFWLVVFNLGSNYAKCSQHQDYHATDLIRGFFREVPNRSAILVSGDLPVGSTFYVQRALREHRNVLVIIPGLSSAQWYRDTLPVGLDLAARKGATDGRLSNEAAVTKMVEYLDARGVPVYCNEIPNGILGQFKQKGLLKQWQSLDSPAEPIDVAEAERTFQQLESSPRRGTYHVDWRQNFWIRYCTQEWVKAYKTVAFVMATEIPEKACIAMDRAISMESTAKLDNHLNRGSLRLHLRRYQEAIQDYEIALRLNPNSRLALEGMIMAQVAVKEEGAAERYRQRLKDLP